MLALAFNCVVMIACALFNFSSIVFVETLFDLFVLFYPCCNLFCICMFLFFCHSKRESKYCELSICSPSNRRRMIGRYTIISCRQCHALFPLRRLMLSRTAFNQLIRINLCSTRNVPFRLTFTHRRETHTRQTPNIFTLTE